MHRSIPPDWAHWPPNWPPPAPVNGADLQIGQTMGQLLVHNEQQTRVLHGIAARLEDLPDRIAKAMPPPPAPAPPPSPPSDKLSSKDRAQLVLAALVVLAAISGRVPLQEAWQVLAKLYGVG